MFVSDVVFVWKNKFADETYIHLAFLLTSRYSKNRFGADFGMIQRKYLPDRDRNEVKNNKFPWEDAKNAANVTAAPTAACIQRRRCGFPARTNDVDDGSGGGFTGACKQNRLHV